MSSGVGYKPFVLGVVYQHTEKKRDTLGLFGIAIRPW